MGKLSIIEHLDQQIAPEELKKSINLAFNRAISGGHYDVLLYLEKKLTQAQLKEMIEKNKFELFR